jgi:hypothetical protein
MNAPRLAFLVTVLSIGLVGCGPGVGDLSGSVSYKGKKVKVGTVTVFGGDGVVKYGLIDRDGNFTVKDVCGGDVRICVASPHPKESLPYSAGNVTAKDKGPKRDIPKVTMDPVDLKNWFEIPEQYQYPDKSGLTFQMRSGANTFNIELK